MGAVTSGAEVSAVAPLMSERRQTCRVGCPVHYRAFAAVLPHSPHCVSRTPTETTRNLSRRGQVPYLSPPPTRWQKLEQGLCGALWLCGFLHKLAAPTSWSPQPATLSSGKSLVSRWRINLASIQLMADQLSIHGGKGGESYRAATVTGLGAVMGTQQPWALPKGATGRRRPC